MRYNKNLSCIKAINFFAYKFHIFYCTFTIEVGAFYTPGGHVTLAPSMSKSLAWVALRHQVLLVVIFPLDVDVIQGFNFI